MPVIANGNILFHTDIETCLAATGADAVMSAEGNLYNPAVFMSSPSSSSLDDPALPSTWCIPSDTGLHLPHTRLALEYLSIVRSLKTTTRGSAIKGHLFKLLRPALGREIDLRDRLHRVRGKDSETWDKYEAIVTEFEERMLVCFNLDAEIGTLGFLSSCFSFLCYHSVTPGQQKVSRMKS